MQALILDMEIYIFKMWNCLILSKSSVGIIEPYSPLECEVTWLPGFSAPDKGEFILQVDEGNTMTLKCVAHVMISLEYEFYFEGSKLVGICVCRVVGYVYYVSKT